jgi:uncharacterized protein (DUF2141 family)
MRSGAFLGVDSISAHRAKPYSAVDRSEIRFPETEDVSSPLMKRPSEMHCRRSRVCTRRAAARACGESRVLQRAVAFLAVFCSVASASGEPAAGGVGRLVVVPVGLESSEGDVMVQLAADEAGFEGDGEAFRSAKVAVVDRRAECVFDDVPHGDYAIRVFHDANRNEKLDTNFIGVPKEKFGFSNDALGRFGPPSFEQARFRFEAGEASIEIEMR